MSGREADFTILIERLSATSDRRGIVDAIRSLLMVAELEAVEHRAEDALHVVGERRELRSRTFMEWTPTSGWREIV